jgi:hypothetical protein
VVTFVDYIAPLVLKQREPDAIYSYFGLGSAFDLDLHNALLLGQQRILV